MTVEAAHEPGCDLHHTRRQQCTGPVVDARRRERILALEPSRGERAGAQASNGWPSWLTSPRFGAALEMVPAVALAIIWIGSLSASVRYHDLAYLHMLAAAPSFGWLWRRPIGYVAVPIVWLVRGGLIWVAGIMWASANDYGHWFNNYGDSCCRPAYQLGMHTLLAAAVATSVLSAYAVGWWRRDRDALAADE